MLLWLFRLRHLHGTEIRRERYVDEHPPRGHAQRLCTRNLQVKADFYPSNNCAFESNLCLFFGEISNPFNILRIVLGAQGRKQGSAIAGMLFAPVFLIARLIFCTASGFIVNLNPNINYIFKIDVTLMCNFALTASICQLCLGLEDPQPWRKGVCRVESELSPSSEVLCAHEVPQTV